MTKRNAQARNSEALQSPNTGAARPNSESAGANSPKPRLPKTARLTLTAVFVCALALAAYLAFWRANLKRFAIVREGVLIRSGQPTEFGLKYLVRKKGVKTILSLRQEDDIIHIGALDGGEPSGRRESEVVRDLKATYLHWPMGGEAYWPWLPPKQFEEFFELFDNEENLPVAVHCVAGRHRTGTLSALYRLEYDRWPIERVLAEIHSFDFGEPIPVQLVNLRTYTPRPRPDKATWPAVKQQFQSLVPNATSYQQLIQGLGRQDDQGAVAQLIVKNVQAERPFALTVARRMISALPAAEQNQIAEAAGELLSRDQSNGLIPDADISSAAAIVADFGQVVHQQQILSELQREQSETHDDRYFALVRGIGDRFTPNRLPYLRALLTNRHEIPGSDAGGFRYCDLAVARLTAIVNERFVDEMRPLETMWNRAVTKADQWFQDNSEAQKLTQRIPPIEHRMAMDALRLEQDGGDRFR